MKQTSLFTVLISILIGAIIVVGTIRLITIGYLSINNPVANDLSTIESSSNNSKTDYEKIIQSGVIRCGYVTYPPGLIKDPNTGKITGVFPDVLEEAAKNLGLKIEWAEEVGWGTMVEGLQTRRYDVICSPVWPLSQRAKVADFTQPIYFGGAEAYVRQDDTRFDADIEILNDPKYRIATIDGEVTEAIAQRDFPKANKLSLPQLTDISQALLSVAEKKADITFVEPFVAYDFIKNNPDKIRPARPGKPIRLYANTLMLRQDNTILRRTLDNAIDELVNNGFVDQVLRKYESFPGAFYRRAQPFELIKSN